MGCGPQPKVPSLIKAESPIGVLKVVILNVSFPKDATLTAPSLKIRISNQQFATKTIPMLQK